MEGYCFLRSIVDLVAITVPIDEAAGRKTLPGPADREAMLKSSTIATPYHCRLGQDLRGPVYPFGYAVQYKPSSDKEKDKCNKLGPNVLDGVFL